jgi:4-hydroxy-tetrahydrodipicolinate synthase
MTSTNVPKKGIFAALWLPVDDSNNILKADLARNLAFIKSQGIHGVLALGSTGEFPQFDLKRRQRALELVAELAAPLPVIANISDLRPSVVSEMGRFAKQLGLPAVSIMAPGFYPSSQEDLLEHLLNAAESSDLPTFLYNFPELTGTRIDIETVAAFAERANMAGIKQSGGEFAYHKDLVKLGREKGFVVFSGADTRLPEVFGLGVSGCIGGLVNIVPELMVHLFKVCHEKEQGAVSPAFEQVKEVGRIIDQLTFPLNVAAGMEARGFGTGRNKALVSPHSQAIYRRIVAELSAKIDEWGLDRPKPLAS